MCYSHNFYINNQKIKNLVIPESVTSIGVYAFYDCSSLTSVTIGESVTSIGGEAFRNCSSLTSVTIGESVTSIGNYAFSGCSSLTSVTIPNSVTSIGDYAFYDCSSLTSVTIGESVTSIGMYAFNKCSSLTSVTIPNSVTSIGDHAFYDCSSLTSVTIGESVTSIGYGAFNKCSSLTSVTIGESVTSIGNYAFSGCSSLTKTNYTGDIAGWCDIKFGAYSSNPISYSHNLYINDQEIKDLVIPNTVDSIHNYAFEGCSSLTSVTIGESVTSIGKSAFEGCSSLTSVTIGKSVTSIGDFAFYECSSLTSVTIPNSVTSIGGEAFRNCSSLTSVTIGESVTSIGRLAFDDCPSLSSVTIGKSVTSIVYGAFRGCSSLKKTNYTGDIAGWCNIKFGDGSANPMYYSHNFYINDQKIKNLVIPESVKSIGDYAFYECSSLTSVTIGGSVTNIGNYAFSGCSSLTSVTIPNSVTSIGDEAFYECSSLTSVTIGESVTSIGRLAFDDCPSLSSVTINADAIVSEDYEYSNISHIFGSQVTEYIIGGSVTSIGNMAFYKCSSLTSVTIGESVTSIGSDAFFDCSSLTSVTIGESVTSIGSYAFYECSSLTSITCKAATPPTVGRYAFDDVSTSIPVYVPCGCVEAYKAANGWEDFTNIQESLAEYSITVDVNDTIMGTAKVDYNICEGNQISATPNIGYHFVQWSDGVTDNPRTLELTQDTILIAEFAQSFSGQCGDNLYWELVDTTLHITGSGEMYDYTSDSAPWKLLVSSIKVLTIAEDVTKVSLSFDSCSVLESIVWNAKHAADAYNDGQYNYPVFYGICSQITSFTLGENVEYIPSHLCSGMENLTSMTIPNSVTSIGDYAFNECTSLTSVTIPNSVTSIGGAVFSGCTSLTSVTIPESITSIGYAFFYNCTSLTSVTIPESVTSIGWNAFQGCTSLTSITIPESVTSIGWNAFRGCSSLISVTCEAETPPTVGKHAFDSVSISIPVYVPCESIQRYREHNEWGRFQNLQCVKPEDPNPEDPQASEMCLNSADERAVFFQGEEFGSSANVYMWDPANDNKELVGSWPGSAATHLGDGKFKFVIPTSVTGDPSIWMIIWNNGIDGIQTENLTFTMHGLYNMSGVQSVVTTLCDGSNTDDPNEEVITCAEAVSICQQTGTTATTKEYTIRGYVTKIEAVYSEQYDNITFWMADTSPTQMDNSSNSVTSISDYSNIALGKSTTASSSQDSGTLPEYINDGNFNTRWSSEWQDNEYITIDLEQYSFIDHITLHWEFAYASQFAILITDEQPSSSTLSSPLPSSATCYQSSGDVQTVHVAKSGRYITLIGIERATAYGISLYELEAYGMPLLQAYCVKPIQSTDKYVQIGDYVEAVGTLVNYGGTTPEINAGGTYTILTTTTAVENTHIQSSMTNCQKIIRNGQLIILRDGKTYNVMGLEL